MIRKPTNDGTRVALRIADGPGPAFLAAAADEVLRTAGAEVVLIVAATPRPSASPGPPAPKMERLYAWLEGQLLRGGPSAMAARAPIDVPPGVRRLLRPTPDELTSALAAADVDVLIDLGPGDAGDPLPSLPGGRWRLRFANGIGGRRRSRLERPPEAVAHAESLLSIELSSGQTYEAETGVSALHRIGFGRDRDAVYWRAALLPARRLARLVAGDLESYETGARSAMAADPPAAEQRRPRRPPFGGLARVVVRKVVEQALFQSMWTVFVHDREPDGRPPRDLSGFTRVEPPPHRFYADPFVVAAPDGHRLYVEDSPIGQHRGRITRLRSGSDGRWDIERVVLNDVEHRAYPHVLPVDGGLLLTPDNGSATGVDLFMETGGGDGPTPIARRLAGMTVSDPTVVQHDGRFWMFVAVRGHGMNPWDELFLYSATSFADVWQAHPRNPIVADVRRARSAGRIFRRDGDLIRPGQDCSREYGHRIALSVITTLTPDAYEEHPIGFIEPTGFPGVQRTHTYTFDGSIEALDGYRRLVRRPRFLRGRG